MVKGKLFLFINDRNGELIRDREKAKSRWREYSGDLNFREII